MATVVSGNQVRLSSGQIVNASQGGWYDGQQFWAGSLSQPGQIHSQSNQQGAGQQVSQEVVTQTNPANVGYIQAQQLQSPVSVPLTSNAQNGLITGLNAEVEQARKALENTLNKQKEENDAKMAELRKKETETLDEVGKLTTPFREDLENTERERLHINENFEANQTLVNELEQLLTEGNEYIRQQKEVTGLAAVRNPRIQKSMDEVTGRAAIIESVISARNGQIAQAENLIDRSINAIAADRQDRLFYYETILDLNRRDILSLDTDSKNIAQEQLNLISATRARG